MRIEALPTLHFEARTRVFEINCLFNIYNVVIQRSNLFDTVSMLQANTLVQFGPISTLCLEAMRG